MRYVQKDPDAIEDYRIDWSRWLDGETIASSVWLLDPGITLVSSSHTQTATRARIGGGTVGRSYRATCRVTSSTGRVADQTILILIEEA